MDHSARVTCALVVSLLAVPSCIRAQDDGIRVSNFVSGPICRYDEGSEEPRRDIDVHATGEVCEAKDVEIRGEGRCVYAGEEKDCTWFGFSFDYENKDPDDPITCIWTRSDPANEGDIEEVRKTNAVADTLDLQMGDAASGHYYHPMYQLYAAPPVPMIVTMDYTCTYRDAPLFYTDYRLIFSPAFAEP